MCTFAWLLRSLEQDRNFVLGDVVLVDRIEVLRLGAVPAAHDYDAFFAVLLEVGAAEGIDFRKTFSFRFEQGPDRSFRVERVYLVGRTDVSKEPSYKVNAGLRANESVLRTGARKTALGLNGLPVELLHLIVKANGVKVTHVSPQNLIAAINVEPGLAKNYFLRIAHAAL